jgi:purine-binding chemotaxis protein CheW
VPLPGATRAGASYRVLLFGIRERLYGCEIETVREIIPLRRATRLPGAPEYVDGLVNLRGSILTIVDLGRRLGASDGARADGSIVLVERGTKVVGVCVDEVKDVQPLAAGRMEPASGDQARGGIVRGVGHLEDETVVILLDMHAIVRQVLL